MTELEKYYNKFNEDKRLKSRHGIVEYTVSMKYIKEYLDSLKESEKSNIRIADIGAGTGRYSIPLAEEGYDVTAVELVKYNLGILKKHSYKVKAFQGNALKLKKLKDNDYDLVILFGPMYHLISFEEKVQALKEAKRIVKPDGVIMVAYCMNDYAIIIHGFRDNHFKDSIKDGKITEDFRCNTDEKDLYSYVRIQDIDKVDEEAGVKRIKIFTPDGPSDYMRPVLNSMDDETFMGFINYQMSVCERPDLIGAGSHVVDIVRKEE
ncbi:MAG: class I SAM-dependent methyltransferase [Lachnospiraceae bacterium]|nr:class I SAM-dependent methyltransferase [Lachnospiraceae bacterium]